MRITPAQLLRPRRAGRLASGRPRPQASGTVVVLIHGLGANRWFLWSLDRHLVRAGFRTINWSYPSVRREIETHGRSLRQLLRHLEEDPGCQRIHLVTHSMGGIIARWALAEWIPGKLGRIAMLGPPNQGSHVATRVARLLGWFCKPLSQLSDRADSFVNLLPAPQGLEIGVIAALHDRVVRVRSTFLPVQADHLEVPCGHNMILFRRDVALHVEWFLKSGAFALPPEVRSAKAVRLIPVLWKFRTDDRAGRRSATADQVPSSDRSWPAGPWDPRDH